MRRRDSPPAPSRTALLPPDGWRAPAFGGIAGFVDAVGFVALFGVFTANMSGNSARLGVELGEGNLGVALTRLVPLVAWALVVTVAVVWIEVRRPTAHEPLPRLLMIEAAFVTAFMVVGTVWRDDGALRPESGAYYVLVVLAVVAMGVQTATVRRVADSSVHTTFVSGMIVALAEQLARVRRERGPDRDPELVPRARMHAALILAYIVGAAIGAAALLEIGLWCLGAPIVALIALAGGTVRGSWR